MWTSRQRHGSRSCAAPTSTEGRQLVAGKRPDLARRGTVGARPALLAARAATQIGSSFSSRTMGAIVMGRIPRPAPSPILEDHFRGTPHARAAGPPVLHRLQYPQARLGSASRTRTPASGRRATSRWEHHGGWHGRAGAALSQGLLEGGARPRSPGCASLLPQGDRLAGIGAGRLGCRFPRPVALGLRDQRQGRVQFNAMARPLARCLAFRGSSCSRCPVATVRRYTSPHPSGGPF